MEVEVKSLDGDASGKISLSEDIFGLEPRIDIIHRVVRWQLAKKRAGTHHVKGRSEITGSGSKIHRQKGTGRARHSSRKVTQFRGGGKSFGPLPRDHAHKLPKKVRALGLRHALSGKAKAGGILVLKSAELGEMKTKLARSKLSALGLENALIIGGNRLDENFRKACANIPQLDILPVAGINVYSILRRHKLALTQEALESIEARLGAGS